MYLGYGYDYKFIMDNALNSLITVGSIELFRCFHRILLNNLKIGLMRVRMLRPDGLALQYVFARKSGSSQLVLEPGLSMNACIFHNLFTLLKYPVHTPSL